MNYKHSSFLARSKKQIDVEDFGFILEGREIQVLNSSGLIRYFNTKVFVDVLERRFDSNIHNSNI